MLARRHMVEYGTTTEHLGHVAVTMRANAARNERAIMRDPITLEDHRRSRWIAEPFRLLDCCQETDAACALVISRADAARDGPHAPVYLRGWAMGGRHGPALAMDRYPDFTTSFAAEIAPRLWANAGVGVEDIDVAALYDAFTYLIITQLEDFGFCPKGEGGPFVASGAIGPGGSDPSSPGRRTAWIREIPGWGSGRSQL